MLQIASASVAAGLLLASLSAGQAPRTPTLLVDLDRTSVAAPRSSAPGNLFASSGRRWFSAASRAYGRELWVTDGTPAGTNLVDDFGSGSEDALRECVRLPDGTLVASAWTSAAGIELHSRRPGAASFSLLADLFPGVEGSDPELLRVWQNECWFVVDRHELWRTDGTVSGTRFVEDLRPLVGGANRFYVSWMEPGAGGLWITAGFSAPLLVHKPMPSVAARVVMDSGQALALLSWKAPLAHGLVYAGPGMAGRYGDDEPWFTDGTPAGTVRLADIRPGTASSSPWLLDVDARRAWFVASNPTHGRELWVTDGTPAGTRMVADMSPGPSSGIHDQHAVGIAAFGGLVFAGMPGGVGVEPCVSDGTATGTGLLVDVWPGFDRSDPADFVAAGSRVWFTAENRANGRELWSTDGSRAGTRLELDLYPGIWGGTARNLGGGGNRLLPAGGGRPRRGEEPWSFDPATGAATMLRDIDPGPVNAGHGIEDHVVHDDFALFLGSTTGDRQEAIVTFGSARSTFVLPGFSQRTSNRLWILGELARGAVFQSSDPTNGAELWLADGSPQQPLRLAVLDARQHVPLGRGVVYQGSLWFTIDDGNGLDLWKTDGTVTGTRRVVLPGAAAGFRPMFAHQDLLFGRVESAMHGDEPWVTDGTAAGTRLLADVIPGPQGSYPGGFAPIGGRVMFFAQQPVGGSQPWISDGTPGGTTRLSATLLGPAGSDPSFGASLGDVLVFRAWSTNHGLEPWRTDGTAAGTFMLVEIGAQARDDASGR